MKTLLTDLNLASKAVPHLLKLVVLKVLLLPAPIKQSSDTLLFYSRINVYYYVHYGKLKFTFRPSR